MGLGGCAGLARRVGAVETGVVMTMPVRGVVPVLLQGWPLTIRTWWMGAAEGNGDDSLVASITGLWSSCGAAIMGGGGAGAIGTLVDVAGFGLTCWRETANQRSAQVFTWQCWVAHCRALIVSLLMFKNVTPKTVDYTIMIADKYKFFPFLDLVCHDPLP